MYDLSQYAEDVAKRIKDIKGDLAPLESGKGKIASREGDGPWVDKTPEWIERHRNNIALYENILKALKGLGA